MFGIRTNTDNAPATKKSAFSSSVPIVARKYWFSVVIPPSKRIKISTSKKGNVKDNIYSTSLGNRLDPSDAIK